jgi:hypothetical protein
MGVNIYILDRRPARLRVGEREQSVGSLRRFWKITELDEERAGEIKAADAKLSAMPSPRAAMVADVEEMPFGSATGIEIKAHPVIGWDEGRTRVTDMDWDYLPVLGYAIRDPDSGVFVLHENRDGVLHRMDYDRAVELGLIGSDGQLVRRGQPTIAECRSVRPYIPGYAEADCAFDDGQREKLLIAIVNAMMPKPEWFVGKRPMDVEHFPAPTRSTTIASRPESPRHRQGPAR